MTDRNRPTQPNEITLTQLRRLGIRQKANELLLGDDNGLTLIVKHQGRKRDGDFMRPQHHVAITYDRGRDLYDVTVFEISGTTDKLNAFIRLMEPLGLVDVSRTGVVAIARGPGGL